jgi:hypothetical protein
MKRCAAVGGLCFCCCGQICNLLAEAPSRLLTSVKRKERPDNDQELVALWRSVSVPGPPRLRSLAHCSMRRERQVSARLLLLDNQASQG